MVHYNGAFYEARYTQSITDENLVVIRQIHRDGAGTGRACTRTLPLATAITLCVVIPFQGGYVLNAEMLQLVDSWFFGGDE